MLLHYIKLALRTIWKNRIFSTINILGLAVGITCFLLVGGYVWQEWQVNRSLRNLDHQYIIQSKWKQPNMGIESTTVGYLPRALKDHYAHLVANYYRFDGVTSNVANGEKVFREGLQVGDSTLLNMYGFSLKYGDEKTALDEPFSLVLTTEKAQKYFGKEDVVGKSLTIENFSGEWQEFKITGVLEKDAQNSITNFSVNNDNHFFIPTNTLRFFRRSIDNWQSIYTVGYLELQAGVQADQLIAPMKQLIQDHTQAHIADNLNPYLVPLKSYYLDVGKGAVRKMIYTLSAISFFILLMAIINFVNIAVSKADLRKKEIGVRKVLGSLRTALMTQFYVEALLLVTFSTIIGLGLYALTRPLASSFLSNEIPSLLDFSWHFGMLLLGLIVVVSLLAGTYPALIISGFQPIQAMKGQLTRVRDKAFLHKGLLAFQFFVAAVVLIGASIINQQVNHFFSKDLGYDKSYVITAPVSREWTPEGVQKMETFRKQLTMLAAVEQVSLSYSIPSGNTAGQQALFKMGADSTNTVAAESIMVDANYAETYNLEMAAGEFHHPANATRAVEGLLLNESASKALGWENPAETVGKRIRLVNIPVPFEVKGIIKDYHYNSLHEAIQPAVFLSVSTTNLYRYFSIKLQAGNINEALASVQQKWSELMPTTPFDYQFQDETFADLYIREVRLKKAAYVATFLAIVIALLGVFGLLALGIQKRTREIGIRKVIGARAFNIIALFLRDFLPVVLLASLLACPVAWYFSKSWLAAYTYRIPMTILPFLSTLLLLGGITVVLIILQSLRASAMNPVEAIKEE
ncbi:MAG: ABC transporter permease [Bacteroidota bacterium]